MKGRLFLVVNFRMVGGLLEAFKKVMKSGFCVLGSSFKRSKSEKLQGGPVLLLPQSMVRWLRSDLRSVSCQFSLNVKGLFYALDMLICIQTNSL